MNIKDKIIEVSSLLDELDTFEEDIPSMTQYFDYRLSDLYHLLENSKLNSKFCYRFCKELQLILKERREYKTNMEVFYTFKRNIQKVNNGKDNRKIMITQVCNEDRKIRSSKYNNRIYTEEELKELIGV